MNKTESMIPKMHHSLMMLQFKTKPQTFMLGRNSLDCDAKKKDLQTSRIVII